MNPLEYLLRHGAGTGGRNPIDGFAICKGVNFMRQNCQNALQGLTYPYLILCARSNYKSSPNTSISNAYATFVRPPPLSLL